MIDIDHPQLCAYNPICPSVIVINESGLYSLILRSDKPGARRPPVKAIELAESGETRCSSVKVQFEW